MLRSRHPLPGGLELAEVGLEAALIDASRRGDEDAFRDLVQPLSREVHLLCYRLLGSFQDAEDALQETLLKAWRGIAGFDGRSAFRTWLQRIATNTCLDLLRSRKRRVLPQDVAEPIVGPRTHPSQWGDAALDVPWLEPYPDALLPESVVVRRETISLAFIRALQLLPPRQRAVLVLRDVLDWPAAEVAATLGTSVAAVNSALQRARATAAAARAEAPALSESRLEAAHARIAREFVRVWEQGDLEGLLALLTHDAIQTMAPWLAWFRGTEALRASYWYAWDGDPRPGVFRAFPAPFNGQPAFVFYHRPAGEGPFRAIDVLVVTLNDDGSLVRELHSFVRPDLFPAWGYPPEVE